MNQIDALGNSITIIHFTHDLNGEWRIACMPGMVEFHRTPYHPAYARSNDVRAVTCPQCKKSGIFQEHTRALDSHRGPARG